jgi:hypothetical protein
MKNIPIEDAFWIADLVNAWATHRSLRQERRRARYKLDRPFWPKSLRSR